MKPDLTLRSYSSEPQLHNHLFHQIVLPRCGSLELEVAGRGGRVDQGQGAFIPAGETHIFSSREYNKFIVFDIPTDDLESIQVIEAAAAHLSARIFFPIKQTLRLLFEYIARLNVASFEVEGVKQSWMTLVLLDLVDSSACHSVSTPGTLVRALAYIEQHLGEAISVLDIARAAGVSERHLHLLFRNELGSAPHSYLIERRLDCALDLLADTRLSVPEIAFLTGHADQSALTRRLKKQRGVTPAVYRRNWRENRRPCEHGCLSPSVSPDRHSTATSSSAGTLDR